MTHCKITSLITLTWSSWCLIRVNLSCYPYSHASVSQQTLYHCSRNVPLTFLLLEYICCLLKVCIFHAVLKSAILQLGSMSSNQVHSSPCLQWKTKTSLFSWRSSCSRQWSTVFSRVERALNTDTQDCQQKRMLWYGHDEYQTIPTRFRENGYRASLKPNNHSCIDSAKLTVQSGWGYLDGNSAL